MHLIFWFHALVSRCKREGGTEEVGWLVVYCFMHEYG